MKNNPQNSLRMPQKEKTSKKSSAQKRTRGFKQLLSDSVRRFIDIIGSVLGLLFLSPFLGVIAYMVKRDSPGPVLYIGQRSGRGGGTFQMLKFRTMYESPESYNGPKVTAQDDIRITQFGRWLRDTKLNEIPQLWNVLKGEMSLVGPRPENPEIVAAWPESVRQEILSVRPGITSPASVLYRNEEELLDNESVMETYLEELAPSKLRLDQLYVRHRSLLLDLDALLWTFLVLLPRLGSHQPLEEVIFWGPISRLMRRYMSWFMIDTATTISAYGLTVLFWRSFGPFHLGWPLAIASATGFALLFSLIGSFFGLQKISWSQASITDIIDLIPASIVATILAFGANYIFAVFPPGVILIGSFLSLGGFIVTRYRTRLITGFVSRKSRFRKGFKGMLERILIVGCGDAGQFAAWYLGNARAESAFQVVGYIDDDMYKQGVRIRGISVLGRSSDIQKLVEEHDIGIIVFAIHNIKQDDYDRILDSCHATSAQVIILPNFLKSLQIVASAGGNGKKVADTTQNVTSPQHDISLQSNGFTANQVDGWLKDLERSAQRGDISEVKDILHSIRQQLEE